LNILIIHEIDWINKVVFEPHHLSELFSKDGHNVFVIDCPDTENKQVFSNLKTKVTHNYSRIYDDASITLIHPPSLLVAKKLLKKQLLKIKSILFFYMVL